EGVLGDVRGWAEDVTQDAFAKLLEHFGSLDADTDLSSWLYRVTANLAITGYRRETKLFGKIKALFGFEEELADSAEALYEVHESARECTEAIAALRAPERVVLWMKLIDGKSQREIASLLSLSEGQISK